MEKDFTPLLTKIKGFAGELDGYLLEILKGRYAKIWEAAAHYIKAGGKRLRPFIIWKTFSLLAQTPPPDDETLKRRIIFPAAGSVELLHTFSLVHDDIMDKDTIRRGVPTVHTKWDEPTAILAGDLLFAIAFSLMNRVSSSDSTFSVDTFRNLNDTLSSVSVDLCEGQTMDMDFETGEYGPHIGVEDYMDMISLKTAALFKACCRIGALLAGAGREETERITEYGFHLGVAFQLIDDILGIKADEKKLGKSVGLDIKEGKKTYLLLYAMDNLTGKKREELLSIMQQEHRSDEDVRRVIHLFEECGAISAARSLAESHITQALSSLSNCKKRLSQGKALTPIQEEAYADLEDVANFNLIRIF